jgi:FkbM family methyltransferase
VGSQLAYYIRRIITEVWIIITPTYTIDVGKKKIRVPGSLREAARLVRDWGNGWKTSVIRHHYNPDNGVFIDIGTNIGDTLLDFLAVSGDKGQYIGFEPNYLSSSTIAAIIARNSAVNASIVPTCLSDRAGIVTLFTHTGHPADASASIVTDLRPGRPYDKQLVPCLRFSDVARILAPKPISFVKIDVEGAELSVMRGMKDLIISDKPIILCEVLHRDSAADESKYVEHIEGITRFIREIDYKIYRVMRQSDGVDVTYVQCETFPNRIYAEDSVDLCDYLFTPIGFKFSENEGQEDGPGRNLPKKNL